VASVSGAFSSYPSLLTYIVTAEEVATNIALNQSTVRVKAFIQFTGGSASSSGGSGVAAGAGWSRGFTSFSGAGTIEVLSSDTTVSHSADGSGSYSFSGTASMSGWGSAATGTGTLTLSNFDFTPSTPTSFAASYVAGTGVILTWGASTSYITPVTYYHSYRSSSDGGLTWGSWSSDTLTTSLTATYGSLTPGLTYQFRIRAYNGQDNSSAYATSNNVFLTGIDWALTVSAFKRYTGSTWTNVTTAKQYVDDVTGWVNLS
jgi:hypothetical protein